MTTRSKWVTEPIQKLPEHTRKRKFIGYASPIFINIDLTHYNNLDPIDVYGYDTLREAICIPDGPVNLRGILEVCEPIVRARLPVGRLAMGKFKILAKTVKVPIAPTRCFDSIASALSYGIIIATSDNTPIIVYERSHKDNSYMSARTTIIMDAGDILIMRGDLMYSSEKKNLTYIQTYVGCDKRFK
jgi:hypothetical protein